MSGGRRARTNNPPYRREADYYEQRAREAGLPSPYEPSRQETTREANQTPRADSRGRLREWVVDEGDAPEYLEDRDEDTIRTIGQAEYIFPTNSATVASAQGLSALFHHISESTATANEYLSNMMRSINNA